MPTIEREIDALGGAQEGSGEYNGGYHDGYSAALTDAMEVAANADALVEELLECIDDVLRGSIGLERWASQARTLHQRASSRRAA